MFTSRLNMFFFCYYNFYIIINSAIWHLFFQTLHWWIQVLIEWLILMACQPILGYFRSKGSGNVYIVRLYEFFFKVFLFIIKGFQTIVFIFIVISTTFRPICPPAFFRCLLNLHGTSSVCRTYTELRTTSFIESVWVACSDSVNHNRVQVLRIPFVVTRLQSWLNPQPSDECLLGSLGNFSK